MTYNNMPTNMKLMPGAKDSPSMTYIETAAMCVVLVLFTIKQAEI